MTKKSGIYFAGHQQQSWRCSSRETNQIKMFKQELFFLWNQQKIHQVSGDIPQWCWDNRQLDWLLNKIWGPVPSEIRVWSLNILNQKSWDMRNIDKLLHPNTSQVPFTQSALSFMEKMIWDSDDPSAELVDDFNFSKIRRCDRSEPTCSGKVRTKWV